MTATYCTRTSERRGRASLKVSVYPSVKKMANNVPAFWLISVNMNYKTWTQMSATDTQ